MKIQDKIEQRKGIILDTRFIRMELSYSNYYNAFTIVEVDINRYQSDNNSTLERRGLARLIWNLIGIIDDKHSKYNGAFTAKGINLNIAYDVTSKEPHIKNDLRTLQFNSKGHVNKLITGLKHLIQSYLRTIDECEYYKLSIEQYAEDNGLNTNDVQFPLKINNHPRPKNYHYVQNKISSFKSSLIKLHSKKSLRQIMKISRRNNIIINTDNLKWLIESEIRQYKHKCKREREHKREHEHNPISDLPF